MSREKKVTIRFSDQELSDLTSQMEKAGRSADLPAAMKGMQKENTLSAFIRERCLTAGPEKELKKIRLQLMRMETTLEQISMYLKRISLTGAIHSSDIFFTELCRELQAVKGLLERIESDGGNGTETH